MRCTVYSCKVGGPDQGPKYDWECDYIDCWGQSATYNKDFIDDDGFMKKDDLEVQLAVRKQKWERFDIIDERRWKELGRDQEYIDKMSEIKRKSRASQE